MARKGRGGKGSPDEVERGGFLRRWSERKSESRSSLQTEESARRDDPDPTTQERPLPAELTDRDLPSIESLSDDSDYRGFLSSEVSEKLRKAALRKLFHLPRFNVRDGLDDYDDDFRSFEPLGAVVTADMRHRRELESEEEAPTGGLTEGGPEAGDDEQLRGSTIASGEPQPEPPGPAPGAETSDDGDLDDAEEGPDTGAG